MNDEEDTMRGRRNLGGKVKRNEEEAKTVSGT